MLDAKRILEFIETTQKGGNKMKRLTSFAITIVLVLCVGIVLSACTKTPEPEPDPTPAHVGAYANEFVTITIKADGTGLWAGAPSTGAPGENTALMGNHALTYTLTENSIAFVMQTNVSDPATVPFNGVFTNNFATLTLTLGSEPVVFTKV